MIRVLHAADLHLDSPFGALPPEKAAQLRAGQRELLSDIAELADREGAALILLAGDLLDSGAAYLETAELVGGAFALSRSEVFIAPGNHDFYSNASPYARLSLPNNVHIFRDPEIECVPSRSAGVRVWGAAFTDRHCPPLLRGFEARKSGNTLDIMVLHGDVGVPGSRYNAVSEDDIAKSGMDYIAFGHVHAYSGLRRAGDTHYAYPGCAVGRGFDETGEKGVIIADVDEGAVSARFVPLNGRRYAELSVDLTGSDDAAESLAAAIFEGGERDICRITLCGEYAERPSRQRLEAVCEGRFFHFIIRDKSRPRRDIWEKTGEDSLRGIFLKKLRAAYDGAGDAAERDRIVSAVRFGLAAFDNGEDAAL